jgi:hypothetical protein
MTLVDSVYQASPSEFVAPPIAESTVTQPLHTRGTKISQPLRFSVLAIRVTVWPFQNKSAVGRLNRSARGST